jgi:hypothetical protein
MDGGYTNLMMYSDSFGVAIQCGSNVVATISSRIPTIYKDINSHHSKCFGIVISIQIIIALQQYMQINNINIQPHTTNLFCDNKSAVDTINKIR